ncbi:MAG: hypothetical protein ACFE9T_05015 [Promethearchaeota archaeon]
MMQKFTINKFLDLRLENGKTNIYVNNVLFLQCKYLLLEIPIQETEYLEEITSIDEVANTLDRSLEISNYKHIKISPEIQFWGHCSNLQVWYENNYDNCLIHSNLSFPLLKKLTEAGDFSAKKVFKEEIAKRIEEGELSIVQFLLYNGYLNYLNKDERECVLEQLISNLIKKAVNLLKEYRNNKIQVNFTRIKDLIEVVLFIDLVYNKSYILQIFNHIPKDVKELFANTIILHLNYKEFRDYKISYGKFYTFVEQILEYFNKISPKILDVLKLLDSGFYNSDVPMYEKLSYGAKSFNLDLDES